MCAIYGFLDYGKKISNKMLKNLIRELSIAAECRGTDATGISYVSGGKIVTFKQPKPAHKMKLYFPKGTTAVIGHNRLTTQGNEKFNCNNHPFEGKTAQHGFALAHNGVLYNDKEIRREKSLPKTKIETDSYAAVQLLEKGAAVNMDSVRSMAEIVYGSFVFTILRDDNTLFLVKGSNPLTLYHFPEIGLYIYASTKEILANAMKNAGFKAKYKEIPVKSSEILSIDTDGKISRGSFQMQENQMNSCCLLDCYSTYTGCQMDDLAFICSSFGADREDVEFLHSCGYTSDEIEDMLLDADIFEDVLREAKSLVLSEI